MQEPWGQSGWEARTSRMKKPGALAAKSCTDCAGDASPCHIWAWQWGGALLLCSGKQAVLALFLPGPGSMCKTCAIAFVETPSGHKAFPLKILSLRWNFVCMGTYLSQLPLSFSFWWKHKVGFAAVIVMMADESDCESDCHHGCDASTSDQPWL